MKKRTQLFIHKHYGTIKLILLVIIFGLIAVSYLTLVTQNQEASRSRAEAVINVVESIEKETEQQTKDLELDTKRQTDAFNRQFQAMCFLIIEIAGPDALKRIDPPLKEQCKNLAVELRTNEEK